MTQGTAHCASAFKEAFSNKKYPATTPNRMPAPWLSVFAHSSILLYLLFSNVLFFLKY